MNENAIKILRMMAHVVGAILIGTIIGLFADGWRAPDILYQAHETVPPLIGFQLGLAVYGGALHHRQRYQVVPEVIAGLGFGFVPGCVVVLSLFLVETFENGLLLLPGLGAWIIVIVGIIPLATIAPQIIPSGKKFFGIYFASALLTSVWCFLATAFS